MSRYCFLLAVILLFADNPVLLKHYPLDTLEGVISRDDVRIDHYVKAEGAGALRIRARQPRRVLLFETGDLDVENAQLFYRAKLRVGGLKGDAFLEMWCHFPSQGDFFSRGLQYSLSGTTDYISVETPFVLRKGENPDNIRLNLVINGKGTVWIDDVRLEKGPPPE